MTRNAFDGTTLLVLVSLGLCWSLVTPLARIAGTHGVPVLFFPAVASLGGAATLVLVRFAERSALPMSPAHLRLYLVSGTFGHAFPQITLFIAVQHIPIGIAGLVIATTPLMTLALALALRVEGFSALRAAGLGVGFLGALMVLLPRAALPDPAMAPWVVFAFLTPLSWAISNVFSVKLRPATGTPRTNALGMLVVSAIVLWGAVALFGHGYLPALAAPHAGDAALLVNGLVAGLAFVLYFTLLDRAGAVVMSAVSYLNLALATLYGVLFFGERPSLWVACAVAAIVAGLLIMQRGRPRPAG